MQQLSKQYLTLQQYVHSLFQSLPIITTARTDKDLIDQLQHQVHAYGKRLIAIFEKYQQQQQTLNQVSSEFDSAVSKLSNSKSPIKETPIKDNQRELIQLRQQISELQRDNQEKDSKIDYLNTQLEDLTLELMQTNEGSQVDDIVRRNLDEEKLKRMDLEQAFSQLKMDLEVMREERDVLLKKTTSIRDDIQSTGKKQPYKEQIAQSGGNFHSEQSLKEGSELVKLIIELQNLLKAEMQKFSQKIRASLQDDGQIHSNDIYKSEITKNKPEEGLQFSFLITKNMLSDIIQHFKHSAHHADNLINLTIEQQQKSQDSFKSQLKLLNNQIKQETMRSELKMQQCQQLDGQLIELVEKDKIRRFEFEEFVQFIQTLTEEQNRRISSSLDILNKISQQQMNVSMQQHIKHLYEQIQNLVDHEKLHERLGLIERAGVDVRINQSYVQSQSPGKILRKSVQTTSSNYNFKEKLRQDQIELKNKIKASLSQFEEKIQMEEVSSLQKEFDKQSQLISKYERRNIVISRMNFVIEEFVVFIKVYINSLLELADSGEAQTLVLRVQDTIEQMGSQVSQIQQDDGHTNKIDEDYQRQRNQWNIAIKEVKQRQKDQEAQMITEFQQLSTSNQHLQQIINQLEISNKDLNDKLQSLTQTHQKQLLQSKNYVNSIEQSIQVLKQELEKVKSELQEKENQIQSQAQRLEEGQRNIEHFEEALNSGQIENVELRKMLDEVTWSYENIKAAHDAIQKENLVIKVEIDTYKQELSKIQVDVRQMKKSRSQLEQVFEKERNQLKKIIDDQKNQYESKVQQLQNKLEVSENKHKEKYVQAKQMNESLQKELESHGQEIMNLNQTLTELEEFSRKQIEHIKLLEDKLGQILQERNSDNIQKLQENSDPLSNKHSSVKQAAQQLQEENASLRRQLEASQQSLNQIQQNQPNSKLQIHQLEDLQNQLKNSQESYRELENRFQKLNEIVTILRDENKGLKSKLEQRTKLLQLKENEIQNAKSQYSSLQAMVLQMQMRMQELQHNHQNI